MDILILLVSTITILLLVKLVMELKQWILELISKLLVVKPDSVSYTHLGLIINIPYRCLNIDKEGKVDILNVKNTPEKINALIDHIQDVYKRQAIVEYF